MFATRATIAQAMGLVALACVAAAALRQASELWAAAMSTALLASLGGIALGRGPTRAYWIGFAIFGWGYFGLVSGPWELEALPARWLASDLFGRLYVAVHPLPRDVAIIDGKLDVTALKDGKFLTLQSIKPHFVAFVEVGRSVATLLLAMIAGTICRHLDRRSQGSRDAQAASPTMS